MLHSKQHLPIMKTFGKYILLGSLALGLTACSEDFLDTIPKDALSPATAWTTPADAQKFLVGCYDGWESAARLLYMDCASDYGYNNFPWEGYRPLGDGSMTTAAPGVSFYGYSVIGRCNNLLDNIDKITFSDAAEKADIVAQARAIRAYRYFLLGWSYGRVPIITNLYKNAEEAKVPQNSEDEVRKFVEDELDAAIAGIKERPSARGRIAKGAALAMRARVALYYGDWEKAMKYSDDIIALNQYALEPDYATLFTVAGQGSREIILAVQHILNTKSLYEVGQMYNNAEGGWSSMVPTHKLVDAYEMKNGKTINESGSGYDPKHPFKDRDPRMAKTILFPGADYVHGGVQKVYNSLDQKIGGADNDNYMLKANNSSKTGLTWRKYLYPDYGGNMWQSNASPIVFRYAEVLLTWAEAATEKDFEGNKAKILERINLVRKRAGMPEAAAQTYSSKEQVRELIRRERGVEFAGEGIRRADLLRWKDASGKMLAETALKGRLERRVGTVDMKGTDQFTRATITVNASDSDKLIEERNFAPHMRYFPIPQANIDKNPKLEPTTGYSK